eukprot:4704277-Pyramimonas_sp.AAC.1
MKITMSERTLVVAVPMATDSTYITCLACKTHCPCLAYKTQRTPGIQPPKPPAIDALQDRPPDPRAWGAREVGALLPELAPRGNRPARRDRIR